MENSAPIFAFIATLIAVQFKGLFHKVITFGLTISVILAWATGNREIALACFILFAMMTILTFIYGLTVKDLNRIEKISIITMGFFMIINSFSKLLHLPGA
jgi:hypothetical protein